MPGIQEFSCIGVGHFSPKPGVGHQIPRQFPNHISSMVYLNLFLAYRSNNLRAGRRGMSGISYWDDSFHNELFGKEWLRSYRFCFHFFETMLKHSNNGQEPNMRPSAFTLPVKVGSKLSIQEIRQVSLKGWKRITAFIVYHNVADIKFDLSQLRKTNK